MNILIVEDEPKTAKLLQEIILKNQAKSKITAICESIEETVALLNKNTVYPDLIFMDIQLADGLSFEIFQSVQINCPVIFCSAFNQYMLEAFQNNGIAYILKPFQEKEIGEALEKFSQLKQFFAPSEEVLKQLSSSLQPEITYKSTLLIHIKDKMLPIQVKEIACFALENEVLYAYTLKKERYAVFKTIEEIEKSLNPSYFFRINRQMLVHREAILEIQPYFNRKVIVKLNVSCESKAIVSRLKVSEFLEWVENH